MVNKPDKIKRKEMFSSRKDGGVAILNIVIKDESLKIAGIRCIGDLKDQNGDFLSCNDIILKYMVKCNFLDYLGIISAIPTACKTKPIAHKITKPPFLNKMCNSLKHRKLVYTSIISQTAKFPDHLIQKWQIELDSFEIDADIIMNSFQKLYDSTISTKIRSFQYRLIHRIMGVNSKLFRWGIKASNLYDFCDNYEEKYLHLLCTCEKVKSFWVGINHWICEQTEPLIHLNDIEIIMGCPKEVPPTFDLFVTVAKCTYIAANLLGM